MLTLVLSVAMSDGEIVCDGAYRNHLQGVARDASGDLYWSFTTTLVKTDPYGRLVQEIEVENHHGDISVVGDRLYCALNKGAFNDPDGKADNWIVVYETADLKEIGRKATPFVTYGAGGISSDGESLLVVGGLPNGFEQNYLYEFDYYLQFQRKYVMESGWTKLGIQTATFAEGRWWFGCYGDPPQLLSANVELNDLVRSEFDCSFGLVPLGDGKFFTARDRLVSGQGHVGSLVPARISSRGKLELVSNE